MGLTRRGFFGFLGGAAVAPMVPCTRPHVWANAGSVKFVGGYDNAIFAKLIADRFGPEVMRTMDSLRRPHPESAKPGMTFAAAVVADHGVNRRDRDSWG